MRVIGAADEFWRLRLTRVDATGAPDFEWRDDVLYRAPAAEHVQEAEQWNVEAIRIEDYETVICIATFSTRDEAADLLARATEDLADMTKHQFEESYLSPSPASEASADLSGH